MLGSTGIRREKKQTVKKRCFYEKEPINQYKKQRYVENPTPQNMYQEVSAKPWVAAGLGKCRYQEYPEIETNDQKKNVWKKFGNSNLILKINIPRKARTSQKYQKLRYLKCQENKVHCEKIDNFLQQVKQGSYHICKVCHRSMDRGSVRFI